MKWKIKASSWRRKRQRLPHTNYYGNGLHQSHGASGKFAHQAESLLHSLERAAGDIGLHVNANEAEYMCFNQSGDNSTLKSDPLKLVNKLSYLRNSVSSAKNDINTPLAKAWTAIDWLSVIWKSDMTNKIKPSFFSPSSSGINTAMWMLTKGMEKNLDSNYTRMLWALLNNSWRQHPTKE